MTAAWLTVAGLFVGTVAIKALGPVALGRWRPSQQASKVIGLVAPAVLAALVVYETCVASNQGIQLDARLVGLGMAGVALALRWPMLVVVVTAAAATALVRAFN